MPVQWSRVARIVFRIRQGYCYAYDGPIARLHHRLVVIPPDLHGDQRLLDHAIRVEGTGGTHTSVWDRDKFGNRVYHVRADRVEDSVAFDATYTVERRVSDVESPDTRFADWEARDYLASTALTDPDARMRTEARRLASDAKSVAQRVVRAQEWAAAAISYRSGVTNVGTTAAMALELGSGVCQDYAHLLLCMLRLLGIPARYVSGHLLGDGAPHAWVEALVEDPSAPGGARVVPYDPTHRRPPRLDSITVAVGRDFADISPTSGEFCGAAPGRMSYRKHVEITELSYVGDDMSVAVDDAQGDEMPGENAW